MGRPLIPGGQRIDARNARPVKRGPAGPTALQRYPLLGGLSALAKWVIGAAVELAARRPDARRLALRTPDLSRTAFAERLPSTSRNAHFAPAALNPARLSLAGGQEGAPRDTGTT
jgi:hypothetical protein